MVLSICTMPGRLSKAEKPGRKADPSADTPFFAFFSRECQDFHFQLVMSSQLN
jgi:hypothetical protein